MGTDKRERQKQNRQLRLESAAKEQQREKTRRRALQIGGGIGAAVVLALLFAIFGGGDDDEAVSSDTTTAVADSSTIPTEPPVTTMAPAATVAPSEPITGETPCPDEDSPRVITFEQAPPMCIDPTKTYVATVTVALDDVEQAPLTIELDAAAAPETVNNFVTLARYHYFDGTVCHRAVPDFVVQCGDPTATGGGGPGYRFDDELPSSLDAYVRGAVAMANSGPGTNGSQFFFVTSDASSVRFGSPNYSVFGQVGDGLDTTLAAMAGLATASEEPSGLIQIVSVEITES